MDHPLQLRVGVVYILFLLYETQSKTPKTKINVSIGLIHYPNCINGAVVELYQELLKLQDSIIQAKLVEPFHIIQRLKQENAFNFTAFVKVDTMLSSLMDPKE